MACTNKIHALQQVPLYCIAGIQFTIAVGQQAQTTNRAQGHGTRKGYGIMYTLLLFMIIVAISYLSAVAYRIIKILLSKGEKRDVYKR